MPSDVHTWGISPSVSPVRQLQPVFYQLEAELKDSQEQLSRYERQAIRRELERVIETYLKD